MLRDLIAADLLPDYTVVEVPGDLMRFERRGPVVELGLMPVVSAQALDRARALAPGMDVYGLQADWLTVWEHRGRRALRNPDVAFIGWVTKQMHG